VKNNVYSDVSRPAYPRSSKLRAAGIDSAPVSRNEWTGRDRLHARRAEAGAADPADPAVDDRDLAMVDVSELVD
jgi:hypothetical protein